MNTSDLERDPALYRAERRVLEIQAKLHRWAGDDPHRRFDDLFNLVSDPAFLLVAWISGAGQQGSAHRRCGRRDRLVHRGRVGVESFLAGLRTDLKARSLPPASGAAASDPQGWRQGPLPGIATIRDRVVQASLKLVLEPIFEADFLPVFLRVPPEPPGA